MHAKLGGDTAMNEVCGFGACIPVPVLAALVGASAALLFALLKTFLDRRQALFDIVRLLIAELENVERHTNDSFESLRRAEKSGYAIERIEMAQFPSGGLLTLQVRDLLGLPPVLIKDLMTLILFLRNTNLACESLKEKPRGEAFSTQLDLVRGRLMIAQQWSKNIRVAMKRNWLTGRPSYTRTTQTPTKSSAGVSA